MVPRQQWRAWRASTPRRDESADARRGLARLLERARTEYVPPGAVAVVYAKLGDTINQDIWLMRAYEEHSNAMAYLLVDTARVWHTDATVVKLIAAVGLRSARE